jgi:competence/damage-inducible protein CinA C-terminal domain
MEPPTVTADVAELLETRGETVATAESATGGLIGSLLTDIPGASAYFDRAVVTYSYRAKLTALGIDRAVLDAEGAVSAPVARQMAQRVRDIAQTDWSVATTGVAGPSGGTAESPVGTVYIGIAHAGTWGSEASFARAQRVTVEGDRQAVKYGFAVAALEQLAAAIAAIPDA